MSPKRIQLRRTKGYRKPEGAISVARPGPYGNPFPLDGDWITWAAIAAGFRADAPGRRAAAVAFHRAWLTGSAPAGPDMDDESGGAIEFSDGTMVTMGQHVRGIAAVGASLFDGPTLPVVPDLAPLRGRDLACWCPVGLPCHADTLLELANPS